MVVGKHLNHGDMCPRFQAYDRPYPDEIRMIFHGGIARPLSNMQDRLHEDIRGNVMGFVFHRAHDSLHRMMLK